MSLSNYFIWICWPSLLHSLLIFFFYCRLLLWSRSRQCWISLCWEGLSTTLLNEVPVGLSNRVWNSSVHTFPMSDLLLAASTNLCNLSKQTMWQRHPLHTVTGQVCGGVKAIRGWTSLSSSLVNFPHFPCLQINEHIMNAFWGETIWIYLQLSLCVRGRQVVLRLQMWPFGASSFTVLPSDVIRCANFVSCIKELTFCQVKTLWTAWDFNLTQWSNGVKTVNTRA